MASAGNHRYAKALVFEDSSDYNTGESNTLVCQNGILYFNGKQLSSPQGNQFDIFTANKVTALSEANITFYSNLVINPLTGGQTPQAGQGFQSYNGRLYYDAIKISEFANTFNDDDQLVSNSIVPNGDVTFTVKSNLDVLNVMTANSQTITFVPSTLHFSNAGPEITFDSTDFNIQPVSTETNVQFLGAKNGSGSDCNVNFVSSNSDNVPGTDVVNLKFKNKVDTTNHTLATLKVIQSTPFNASQGGGSMTLTCRNPQNGTLTADVQNVMLHMNTQPTGNTIVISPDAVAKVGIMAGYNPEKTFQIGPNSGENMYIDTTSNTFGLGRGSKILTQSNVWFQGGGDSVTIGSSTTQAGEKSVVIGTSAGTPAAANVVSIGFGHAGTLSQGVVKIGVNSGATQANAVSIGRSTKASLDGVAIGSNAGTLSGLYSVSIGKNAGSTLQLSNAVAVGELSGETGQNTASIAIGSEAGRSGQGSLSVAIGGAAGRSNQKTSAVAIGVSAGNTSQGSYSVAIGTSPGSINQGSYSVAIGTTAGEQNQNSNAIAIGSFAGQSGQNTASIAIGLEAGENGQYANSIAIGNFTGSLHQRGNTVAIGDFAGYNVQNTDAVAVGYQAGSSFQGSASVAIGKLAGFSGQNAASISIGSDAGSSIQGSQAVAIGTSAGKESQNAYSVAIGSLSGQRFQSSNAVAIGRQSGYSVQGLRSVALGDSAGRDNQNVYSVAIGHKAGETGSGENSIYIGRQAGQNGSHQNNVIVLNAIGSAVDPDTSDGFYVKPVRHSTDQTTNVLSYNTSSGEIINSGALTVDASSNVGIGTASPSANLHVVGNVYSSSNLDTSGWIGINSNHYIREFVGSATDRALLIGCDGNTDRIGIGRSTDDSSTLSIYDGASSSTKNKVGINTSSPSANLHVVGNVYSTSNIHTDGILETATIRKGLSGYYYNYHPSFFTKKITPGNSSGSWDRGPPLVTRAGNVLYILGKAVILGADSGTFSWTWNLSDLNIDTAILEDVTVSPSIEILQDNSDTPLTVVDMTNGATTLVLKQEGHGGGDLFQVFRVTLGIIDYGYFG